MKTLVSRISRNASRGAALLGLAALFAAAPAALAQQTDRTNPVLKVAQTTHAASSGELRAVMFSTGSPLKVKVSFENPALERVVMTIRNQAGQVVHSSMVGRHKTYVAKIDLSALSDGDYTLQLRGESSRYSQPFRIHTETARLALVD